MTFARMFILKDGKPEPCPDLAIWAQWHRDHDHGNIAYVRIANAEVRTVFKGLLIRWGLFQERAFETWVLGGQYSGHCQYADNLKEALRAHKRVVKLIKKTEAA